MEPRAKKGVVAGKIAALKKVDFGSERIDRRYLTGEARGREKRR